MLYESKLVHNGIVKELFYREGSDAEDVRHGLERFDFGKGEWIVTPAGANDDDELAYLFD